jgi:type II secretory pathway pseudopilin PulG
VRISRFIRVRQVRSSEGGYILLTFLLMVALMLIALSTGLPALKTQIKREREEELIHRGHQYQVGIRRFYKKFGRYPTKIEDLQNTNNMRFLRKVYKDPMTANGEFHLMRYGEAQTQPTGLFGKPIGQAQSGGANVNALAAQAGAQAPSSSQGFSLSLPNPSSSMSTSSSGSFGTPIANSADNSGTNPGTPVSSMGTLQSGGPTFGGGPIIGVRSMSEAESLKERRGKSHYNEWEFVYDPRYDPTNRVVTGVNAGAAGQGIQPTGGTPGFSMTPTPTPAPTTPTTPQ